MIMSETIRNLNLEVWLLLSTQVHKTSTKLAIKLSHDQVLWYTPRGIGAPLPGVRA